ncbi:luciferase family protein [Cohnella candidum]|uniref:Luciferase domain-containing protein n=1 Tax=Cohnella candidum TaxID=2674991 RepID=A0A3G3K444_9BACL|nr:luciferase family protein [Cohnella candidum]AYQ75228.1 hypothetical protein EAV92_23375 [Cohnella candidum]
MTVSNQERIRQQLSSWPGVTVQPHRFGGIEFLYRGREIGHLHGDSLVDLTLPKRQRDQALEEGRARPHHIYPESGWVSIYLESEKELDQALAFLRLNYERLAAKLPESE